MNEQIEAGDYLKREQEKSLAAMDVNRESAIAQSAAAVRFTDARASLRRAFVTSIALLTLTLVAAGIVLMVRFG